MAIYQADGWELPLPNLIFRNEVCGRFGGEIKMPFVFRKGSAPVRLNLFETTLFSMRRAAHLPLWKRKIDIWCSQSPFYRRAARVALAGGDRLAINQQKHIVISAFPLRPADRRT